MQEKCPQAGTTRRQTGSASGNSLTSTPSRSPSPNTVSTRMPPTSTLQSSAKESIPRGRRHDYKPYWNNTLEKIHKELSEAREEMERNPTPQNVRRHSQLKVDLDKEKQTQTQASWKQKQHPLTWRERPKNSGS